MNRGEQLRTIVTPIGVAIAGVGLALFLDSRALFYFLSVIAVLIAGVYAYSARRGVFEKNISVHQAVVAFFCWAAASGIFGLRSLQIQPLWVVVIAGLVLSIAVGWLWHRDAMRARLTMLVAAEWFVVLLFAPGNFMVLGGLLTIIVVCTALLFDLPSAPEGRGRTAVRTIVASALVAALFIAGFRWVL